MAVNIQTLTTAVAVGSEKVTRQEQRLDMQRTRLDGHDEELKDHDRRITVLEHERPGILRKP